jgi:hypothetical protein
LEGKEGIGMNIKVDETFIDRVWNGEQMKKYHEQSVKNNRQCPYYKI